MNSINNLEDALECFQPDRSDHYIVDNLRGAINSCNDPSLLHAINSAIRRSVDNAYVTIEADMAFYEDTRDTSVAYSRHDYSRNALGIPEVMLVMQQPGMVVVAIAANVTCAISCEVYPVTQSVGGGVNAISRTRKICQDKTYRTSILATITSDFDGRYAYNVDIKSIEIFNEIYHVVFSTKDIVY